MFDINILEVLTFGAATAALLIAARALKINEDAWKRLEVERRQATPAERGAEAGTILSAVSAAESASTKVGHKVEQVQSQLRGIVTSAAEQHLATHRTEQAVETVHARIGEMRTEAEERHVETIREIKKKPRQPASKKPKAKTGSGSGTSRGNRSGGKGGTAKPKETPAGNERPTGEAEAQAASPAPAADEAGTPAGESGS